MQRIRQYLRVYLECKTGNIISVCTQTTPFHAGYHPVKVDNVKVFTGIEDNSLAPIQYLDFVVYIDSDDKTAWAGGGHLATAGNLMGELKLEGLSLKVAEDKPRSKRLFTLRKVFDSSNKEVNHR